MKPIWRSEPDTQNPGSYRIVNVSTGKTVVYGLSQQDADSFVARRHKQEAKKLKEKQ